MDLTAFRLKLLKPLLAFIVLEILLTGATVKIIHWRATHGRPPWATNISLWDTFANMVLIFGWTTYVQIRRRKDLRQQ